MTDTCGSIMSGLHLNKKTYDLTDEDGNSSGSTLSNQKDIAKENEKTTKNNGSNSAGSQAAATEESTQDDGLGYFDETDYKEACNDVLEILDNM